MADVKISDLPAAISVGGTDLIPIVQSGTTKKATASLFPGVTDGQKIYDGSHVLAADFEARILYGVNGTSPALDWSNLGIIVFPGDIASTNLQTSGQAISVRINDRQLIANDESTVALDWSDPSKIVFLPDVVTAFIDADGFHGPVTLTDDSSAPNNGTTRVGWMKLSVDTGGGGVVAWIPYYQ